MLLGVWIQERARAKARLMLVFLSMLTKGLVMGLFAAITGREMFPANPKGPLYKWLGKASHGSPPALLEPPRNGRAQALLSAPSHPLPERHSRASGRRR
jgi:hypothetical protein